MPAQPPESVVPIAPGDAPPFLRRFHVGWGMVDANGHMRNTAYLDASADVRIAFLESREFGRRRLEELHLGPVALEERIAYRREMRLRDAFDVTLELAGLEADGRRLRLRSRFLLPDGTETAVLTSEVAWMDLRTRRLAATPPALAEAFLQLTPTPDFEPLASRVSSRGVLRLYREPLHGH